VRASSPNVLFDLCMSLFVALPLLSEAACCAFVPEHQVERLLKLGAYDVFREGEDGDKASKAFCEEVRCVLPCAPLCCIAVCRGVFVAGSAMNMACLLAHTRGCCAVLLLLWLWLLLWLLLLLLLLRLLSVRCLFESVFSDCGLSLPLPSPSPFPPAPRTSSTFCLGPRQWCTTTACPR
jgi:hypothetical protein